MSNEKTFEQQDALDIWREKLEFLLKQEAFQSNPLVLFTLRIQIREARSKIEALEHDRTVSTFDVWKRLAATVALLAALPVLLGVLGLQAHRSRETMLRLTKSLDYSIPTLVGTGTEAAVSFAINGLAAPLSSRPEVRTSAWALLALTGICLAALRWHGKRMWVVDVALVLALVVLWVGIHLYTFALRARHGNEEPNHTQALCSSYFLGERATLTEQIVVESCSWLSHPTGSNGPWRQSLSGLVVLFLLANGTVLMGGVRLGRLQGRRRNVRRLLLGAHVVVLLFVLRQVPLAHAYERWGLDYPVDRVETGCCRFDVSEGARVPAFVLWGPSCPKRTFTQDGEQPAVVGARRTVSADCG